MRKNGEATCTQGEISEDELKALRTRAQRLEPKASPDGAPGVVRSLCGVNAQFAPAMALALRARVPGLCMTDVDEMLSGGSFVRTWAMRGTLHLLAVDDARWIVPLLGPVFQARYRRRRYELGLDDERTARGLQALSEAVSEGLPLSRADLPELLRDRGVEIDPRGQALYHLLFYAACAGVVCRGPDLDSGDQTYVKFPGADMANPTLPGPDALARLACRYLQGYGPASREDFAAWSGLSLSDARKAWTLLSDKGVLKDCSLEDRHLSLCEPRETRAIPVFSAHLLPAFDTLTLGYADRQHVVSPVYVKEVYHGGQTRPVLLAGGSAAGVWQYTRKGKGIEVIIRPFEPLTGPAREAVEAEAMDVRRFLEPSQQ